jgi:hypothetical protein
MESTILSAGEIKPFAWNLSSEATSQKDVAEWFETREEGVS